MPDCGIAPYDLTCEYFPNPLGVETLAPRLSWRLSSALRAQRQSAYQVLVASTPEKLTAGTGDLWDSGKVESGVSIHVAYGGHRLRTRQRCLWKVQVWDAAGIASGFSTPASWEMGLLSENDWKAHWIGAPLPVKEQPPGTPPPAPLLRKAFMLRKPVRTARAFVCGLGYFELSVNGHKAGDHALDPGFTRYDRRCLYVTFDVTEHLQAGRNALGMVLGNGWYNSHTKDVWHFETAPWRDSPKLIMQLHVVFEDGSQQTIVSDASWRCATGPILFDGVRNGETYDARQEKPGWDTPPYDDTSWRPALIAASPGGMLSSQQSPPIRVVQTLAPVAVNEVRPGVFVFDAGQNCTGWGQLTVSGPAGTKVVMKYAERLKLDGDIDAEHISCFVQSGEFQTDTYIMKGQGTEVYAPRFTYHGFRWVQVAGFPGTPTLDSLRIRVAHTDFESAGEFSCSHELLNRIQHCTRWAYLSNFFSIPTDCPQREKNGWTGDAQLAAEAGLFNFRAAPAYAKWINDFRDEQRPSGQLPGIVPTSGWGYNWGSGPAWDSAYILIPWYLYLYSGDQRVLEEHYAGMRRYVDYMTHMATEHIVAFGLGDWCPPRQAPGSPQTPESLTSTGYYYADALVVSRTAGLLGKKNDEQKYARLAASIRRALNAKFYDGAKGQYATGTQTAQGCALFQGVVDAGEEGKVLAQLLRAIEACGGTLDFGILGAKYVMNALAMHGRADVAFGIATQTGFPSWGHWLEQGATTLWETWDGNCSRNHIMFGDISAWFFKTLAGIDADPAQPGFRNVIIRPRPVAGLTWAAAAHTSMYGTIRSAWRKVDGRFTLDVSVPVNSTATVHVPAKAAGAVFEGGKPAAQAAGVTFLRQEAESAVFSVGSGEYQFATGG